VWDASSTQRFQSQAANPPALVRMADPTATKKAVGEKPASGQSGGERLSNASSGSVQVGVGGVGAAVAADVLLGEGVLRGVDGVRLVSAAEVEALVAALDSEVLDSEVLDSEVLDSEVLDSEVLDSEVLDSEVLDSEVLDLVTADLVTADLVTADLVTADLVLVSVGVVPAGLVLAAVTVGSVASSSGDAGITVVVEEEALLDVALLDEDFSDLTAVAAVQDGGAGQAQPSTEEASRRLWVPNSSSKE
jgi:hypothetical protein